MSNIYLMKVEIDLRNMARWAAEERHSDPDRTAHCLLIESFGPGSAPKPFIIKTSLENGKPRGTLLAYTQQGAVQLQEAAGKHQRLAHAAVLDPETIKTVPVPNQWAEGQSVKFEIRVRPTKRSSNRDGGSGDEQDFFLMSPGGSIREEVYCQWLAAQARRQGALLAEPENMTVTRMALRKVRRQKDSGWHMAPDVTITGTATVGNPELMESAIANGLGRHKGYGYGMLLLRAPAKGEE